MKVFPWFQLVHFWSLQFVSQISPRSERWFEDPFYSLILQKLLGSCLWTPRSQNLVRSLVYKFSRDSARHRGKFCGKKLLTNLLCFWKKEMDTFCVWHGNTVLLEYESTFCFSKTVTNGAKDDVRSYITRQKLLLHLDSCLLDAITLRQMADRLTRKA